jgi:general secretion pathway protein D
VVLRLRGQRDAFSSVATGAVAAAIPGFSYALTSGDIKVVINALSAVTNVRIVSSPQPMVLNNQVARSQVGDQVPIAVQSAVP